MFYFETGGAFPRRNTIAPVCRVLLGQFLFTRPGCTTMPPWSYGGGGHFIKWTKYRHKAHLLDEGPAPLAARRRLAPKPAAERNSESYGSDCDSVWTEYVIIVTEAAIRCDLPSTGSPAVEKRFDRGEDSDPGRSLCRQRDRIWIRDTDFPHFIWKGAIPELLLHCSFIGATGKGAFLRLFFTSGAFCVRGLLIVLLRVHDNYLCARGEFGNHCIAIDEELGTI